MSVRLRGLRWGGAVMRCRSARALGLAADEAEARDALREALADPAPGVRRAAAWSLGQGRRAEGDASLLLRAARQERCDEPRLAMAVAAARLGAPPSEAWEVVERAAARTLITCYGPRAVAALSGAGRAEMARRWVGVLRPGAPLDDPGTIEPEPVASLRARLWEAVRRDPEDREAFEELAAQQDPRDTGPLARLVEGAGRRASHVHTSALGQGDPRSLPRLLGVLRAVDVDPGAGFAARARAARAIGRLGLPEAAPALLRALEDEAMDFEGRPGAGLGVQLPVRAALLAALGECGAPEAAPTLASYLASVSGSAQGGFHLPAMDALWKLGDSRPLEAMLEGPELAAANAVGVLAALGRRDVLLRYRDDCRPAVARAVAAALG